MFALDVTGRVFRFDINKEATRWRDMASGGQIADLGEGSRRKFFNTLDVGFARNRGLIYYTISVGSGYRANPLNESIEDRFYSFRNMPVFKAPPSYQVLRASTDLYDATDNLIASGTAQQAEIERKKLWSSSGWYIRLSGEGEKVLTRSLTFKDKVIFSTYEPAQNRQNLGQCDVPNLGQSYMYIVDLYEATPVVDGDLNGTFDITSPQERKISMTTVAGIPAAPQVVFGTEDFAGNSTECFMSPPFSFCKDGESQLGKVYWREN